MRIDVFSDMVCPFCYLGKRHLELALQDFEGADQVEVRWRSFELDPDAPATSDQTTTEMIAAKYGVSTEQATSNQDRLAAAGAQVGLDYQFGGTTVANTFDAHRLSHLADSLGGPDLSQRWVDRVMRAYFTEGQKIGDHQVLTELSAEVGLDGERTAQVLASEEFGEQVRADEQRARAWGVRGVPHFVLNGRLAVSGAHPPEALLDALRQAARPVAEAASGPDTPTT